MPLRSGAFRTGLSPFGTGVLPPYQSSPDYTVVQPPDATPPPPGPAPAPGGGQPGRGIPVVHHVPVRHIPKPTSKRLPPPARRKPPVGIEASGSSRLPPRRPPPKPVPVPRPGGGAIHYVR